jgi:hypothetical protein
MPEPLQELASLCYRCQQLNIPVTEQCKELRINCDKCSRSYGEKHASTLDPLLCEECLPANSFDVTRLDYISAGVEQSTNPDGTKTRRYYQTKCKQIILFGQDWLFAELKIHSMSEAQLEKAIEWHRAHVSLMEQEITRHKTEKAHKLASVKIPIAEKTKRMSQHQKAEKLKQLASSLTGNLKQADLLKLIQQLQGQGQNNGQK